MMTLVAYGSEASPLSNKLREIGLVLTYIIEKGYSFSIIKGTTKKKM